MRRRASCVRHACRVKIDFDKKNKEATVRAARARLHAQNCARAHAWCGLDGHAAGRCAARAGLGWARSRSLAQEEEDSEEDEENTFFLTSGPEPSLMV